MTQRNCTLVHYTCAPLSTGGVLLPYCMFLVITQSHGTKEPSWAMSIEAELFRKQYRHFSLSDLACNPFKCIQFLGQVGWKQHDSIGTD